MCGWIIGLCMSDACPTPVNGPPPAVSSHIFLTFPFIRFLPHTSPTPPSTLRRLVFHAVAASMRGLLGDWLLLVTQLEHQLRQGGLNMQALIFHCQVSMVQRGK